MNMKTQISLQELIKKSKSTQEVEVVSVAGLKVTKEQAKHIRANANAAKKVLIKLKLRQKVTINTVESVSVGVKEIDV